LTVQSVGQLVVRWVALFGHLGLQFITSLALVNIQNIPKELKPFNFPNQNCAFQF